MKKFILIFSALVMLLSTATVNAEEYVYTSSGLTKEMTDGDFSGLSAMECPGAIVYADGNLFDQKIAQSLPLANEDYTVYKNSNSEETITLGMFYVGIDQMSGWDFNSAIDACVYRQIDYIEHIGGKMTGYTIEKSNYDTGRKVLNISWDIAGYHHYARFANETGNIHTVGYYDYMFTDNTPDVSEKIEKFNCSFGVAYELQ